MKYYAILLVLLVAMSCDSGALYEETRDFENGIWRAENAQSFQFKIPDRNKKYNITVHLRNSLSYPFHNIFLQYELSDPNGNEVSKELLEYNLFEPGSGKPFGKGIGDIFDHELYLLNNYGFEEPGEYSLKLTQYMRSDSLEHILSVGLRVESSAPEMKDETQE